MESEAPKNKQSKTTNELKIAVTFRTIDGNELKNNGQALQTSIKWNKSVFREWKAALMVAACEWIGAK